MQVKPTAGSLPDLEPLNVMSDQEQPAATLGVNGRAIARRHREYERQLSDDALRHIGILEVEQDIRTTRAQSYREVAIDVSVASRVLDGVGYHLIEDEQHIVRSIAKDANLVEFGA